MIKWLPNYISETPYHVQLKNVIISNIHQGMLSKGAKLPPVKTISSVSLISRQVIVHALDELTEQGVLECLESREYVVC